MQPLPPISGFLPPRAAGVPPASPLRASSPPVHRYFCYALFTTLLTLATLQKSFRDGRLSAAPDWDDVLYLTYAAKRINELYADGLLASLAGFLANPAHSPYSCLLAFLSFLFLGLREWAPYAASALPVFLFLLVCDRLLARLRTPARLLIILYVLSIPTITLTIAQFKPDVPWGMAVATAAVMTLLRPIVGATRKHLILTGVAWAAALLAKPTTSPGTAALAAGCLALAVAQHALLTRRLPRPRDLSPAIATITFTAALLAAPYFAVHWDYLGYYIHHTLAGEYKSTWIIPGGFPVHSTYYLTGQAGRLNLGPHRYILPSVWLLGLTLSLIRRHPATYIPGLSLLLFTLATYLLPTLNPVKNPLLASPLYCTAILSTVFWLAYLARSPLHYFPALSLLIVLVLPSPFLYRYPGKVYPPHSPERALSRPLHRDVLSSLKPHLKHYPQLLTVTATGPVREITLDFYATLDRLPLAFKRPGSDKLPDYQLAFDESDFVLAQDDQVPGSLRIMPNERVQSKVLASLRQRPDYHQIATFPVSQDKHLYLFQRAPIRPTGVFSEVHPLDGLSPLNHPKAPLTSPYVRTNAPITRLLLTPTTPGPATLRLACLPGSDVRSLQIATPDGRVIHTHTFTHPEKLETVALTGIAKPTGELLLRYTYLNQSHRSRDRAVSFTRIELLHPDRQ